MRATMPVTHLSLSLSCSFTGTGFCWLMIDWSTDGDWCSLESLTLDEADWKVNGEEDFSWFGYSLHGVTVANRSLLLIGSPTWKNISRLVSTSGSGNNHRGRCQVLGTSLSVGYEGEGKWCCPQKELLWREATDFSSEKPYWLARTTTMNSSAKEFKLRNISFYSSGSWKSQIKLWARSYLCLAYIWPSLL